MASLPPLRKERNLAYRPGIDGMRAIAVLGVVLYHAGFGPRAGFVGVDVFFVISGFLITSLLEAELKASGRIDLAAFYSRRVRRLLPALAIVLGVTVAACVAFLSYGNLISALQSAAASLVFGANLFFQYTTGSYFGPNVNHLPLLHLWSLGVEEQYYLIWPLALLLVRRLPITARRVIFLSFAFGSLAFAEWALYRGSQAAFYAMPSRWWELSLGALVAWTPSPARREGRWESWLGVLVTIGAMFAPTTHFPGIGALPAVTGTALLLHASSVAGGAWNVLSSRPMVFIGRVSYPFYLWHWPMLALASVAIPGEIPVQTRIALVVVAFLLAVGTWRWVEQPIHAGRSTTAPKRLVGASAFASVALAFALVQVSNSLASAPPPDDLASRTERDHPANQAECHYRGDQPVEPFPRADCTSDHALPVKVAIWGDSHALAMQPLAWAIAERDGVAAEGFTRDSCPPAIDYDNGKQALEASRCKAFNVQVLDHLRGTDTVVLTALWPAPTNADFGAHFSDTLRRLARTVPHIILLGQTPILPAEAPACIREVQLDACNLQRSTFHQQFADRRAFLEGLAAQYPNVTYVDPEAFFCDSQRCPAVKDGYGLYWDNNHVSSTAARHFATLYLVTKGRLAKP